MTGYKQTWKPKTEDDKKHIDILFRLLTYKNELYQWVIKEVEFTNIREDKMLRQEIKDINTRIEGIKKYLGIIPFTYYYYNRYSKH